MHCLRMIRQAILQGDARHHIRHCLNLLRQAVLCASDTTIAPLEPHHETGVGAVHICREWERAYDFIEENQLKWIQLVATNNSGVST
jgi:hypothetical protein